LILLSNGYKFNDNKVTVVWIWTHDLADAQADPPTAVVIDKINELFICSLESCMITPVSHGAELTLCSPNGTAFRRPCGTAGLCPPHLHAVGYNYVKIFDP